MTDTPKLGPCPFCSGPAQMVSVGAWNKCRAAYCESCEIYGPMMATEMTAAYAWNRRPTPSPSADARDAEHFPAESEPARCCFRLPNGNRCSAERETHSFCCAHAVAVRALASGAKP